MDFEINTLIDIFRDYKNKIYKYKYSEEMFEDIDGKTVNEKMESLKKKFKKLMQDYAADKYSRYNSKELFNISSEIQRKIIELEKDAEEKVVNGTYGKRIGLVNTNGYSVIIVDNREYRIYKVLARKDMADIHRGEYVNGSTPEPVWIKISRDTDDDGDPLDSDAIKFNNDSIANEILTLKDLDTIKDPCFQKVRKQHFPVLLDNFEYLPNMDTGDDHQEDPVARQASVIKYFKGYDLVTLREKYPKGVPLYHACWILARLLSATGYLHFNRRLNGNITPSGIYVIPQDHNVVMGDFMFSIRDLDSKQARYIGITPFYTAPEVDRNTMPHPRTDMYSLGMCMVYLLGGDVEKRILPNSFEMIQGQKVVNMDGIERIRNLILSFINKHPLARSDDAWKAYHQLSKLRKETFGKQEFIEFTVPK